MGYALNLSTELEKKGTWSEQTIKEILKAHGYVLLTDIKNQLNDNSLLFKGYKKKFDMVCEFFVTNMVDFGLQKATRTLLTSNDGEQDEMDCTAWFFDITDN